jgi:hypothetical protein
MGKPVIPGGGISKPKPIPKVTRHSDKEARDAARRAREKMKGKRGRKSTILTGPLGVANPMALKGPTLLTGGS